MQVLQEDIEDAEYRLRLAWNKLQDLAAYNGPWGARVDAEQKYGQAYQVLVKLGARPQIRGKYRGWR